MQDSIEILIKACINQERQAQGKLYQKYSPKMYGLCLRYCKNEDDAKDCLQEAFILAFEKIHQFKFNGSFEGWLRRLTLNVCLGKLRKKSFYVVIDEEKIGEQNEIEEYELETLSNELDYSDLQAIIERMPQSYQMVFNLYLIEDYTHKEIGEMLNISEGTSKSNLSRAKAWMRKELKKNKKFEEVYKK